MVTLTATAIWAQGTPEGTQISGQFRLTNIGTTRRPDYGSPSSNDLEFTLIKQSDTPTLTPTSFAQVILTIADDGEVDSGEQFRINNPNIDTSGVIVTSSPQIIIINDATISDDPIMLQVRVLESSGTTATTVAENGLLEVRARITVADEANAVTGQIMVIGDGDNPAVKDDDFSEGPYAFSIPAGQLRSSWVAVALNNDNNIEPDEGIALTVGSIVESNAAANYTAASPLALTIIDDEIARLALSADVTVAEDVGNIDVTLMATWTEKAADDAQITGEFVLSNDAAVSGEDFTTPDDLSFSIIRIADSATSTVTLSIPIIDDNDAGESEHAFVVGLDNLIPNSGIQQDKRETRVTITDNEQPQLILETISASEQRGVIRVKITAVRGGLTGAIAGKIAATQTSFSNAATATVDFSPDPVNFTIANGSEETTVDISVVDDSIAEGNESVFISITEKPETYDAPAPLRVRIEDNESISIELPSSPVNVSEGDIANIALNITRAPRSGQDDDDIRKVTLSVSITDDGSVGAGDYTEITTFDIPRNASSATVQIQTNQDTLNEGDEQFDIVFAVTSPNSGVVFNGDNTVTMLIEDDDVIGLAVQDVRVKEGENARVRVTLPSAAPIGGAAISINPQGLPVAGATAVADVDFNGTVVTGTIPAGARNFSGSIATIQNTELNPDRTFVVSVSVAGYEAPVTATVTIQNDDMARLYFADATFQVAENAGPASLTIKVERAIDFVARIPFMVKPVRDTDAVNPATPTDDFDDTVLNMRVPASNSDEITVNVPIVDDDGQADPEVEETENFLIELSTAVDGVTVGDPVQVSILDNDKPRIVFVRLDRNKPLDKLAESGGVPGRTMNLALRYERGERTGLLPAFNATVNIEHISTGRDDFADDSLNAFPKTVTFPKLDANQMSNQVTVDAPIEVINDEFIEGEHQFRITLDVPGNYTAEPLVVTIEDNDIAVLALEPVPIISEGETIPLKISLRQVLLNHPDAINGQIELLKNGSDTAQLGTDFTAASLAFSFSARSPQGTVISVESAPTLKDGTQDGTKTLTARMNPIAEVLFETQQRTVSILDLQRNLISVSPKVLTVNEQDGFANFEVSITRYLGGENEDISGTVALTPGTAMGNGVDFDSAIQTFSLPAENRAIPSSGSKVTQEITIPIVNDNDIEDVDETFMIALDVSTTGYVLEAQEVSVSIVDDDKDKTFIGIDNASIEEGDSGNKTLALVIRVIPPSSGGSAPALSGMLSLTSGTAQAGTDFINATPTFSINATSTESLTMVNINIVGDRLLEGEETFSVALTGVTSGGMPIDPAMVYVRPAATVTIEDNENTAVIIDSVQASEDGGVVVTLMRKPAGQPGTVSGKVITSIKAGDTAMENDLAPNAMDRELQFTLPNGQDSVILNAIPLNNPSDRLMDMEPPETFSVSLQIDTAGYAAGAPVQAMIQDDEEVRIYVENVNVTEGGKALLVIFVERAALSRRQNKNARVSLSVSGNGDGHAEISEFGEARLSTTQSLDVVIPSSNDGITVEIATNEDTVREANETFYAELASSDAGVWVSQARSTITIMDNDEPIVQFVDDMGNAINSFNVNENVASGKVAVHLALDGALPAQEQINGVLIPASGTARNGEDFPVQIIPFAILPNEQSSTVEMMITDDSLLEGIENFMLDMRVDTEGYQAGADVSVTINDNDNALLRFGANAENPQIRFSVGSNEEFVELKFHAQRAAGFTEEIPWSATLIPGTAVADADYAENVLSGTFQNSDQNSILKIPLIVSALGNVDKTFTVRLSSNIAGISGEDAVVVIKPESNIIESTNDGKIKIDAAFAQVSCNYETDTYRQITNHPDSCPSIFSRSASTYRLKLNVTLNLNAPEDLVLNFNLIALSGDGVAAPAIAGTHYQRVENNGKLATATISQGMRNVQIDVPVQLMSQNLAQSRQFVVRLASVDGDLAQYEYGVDSMHRDTRIILSGHTAHVNSEQIGGENPDDYQAIYNTIVDRNAGIGRYFFDAADLIRIGEGDTVDLPIDYQQGENVWLTAPSASVSPHFSAFNLPLGFAPDHAVAELARLKDRLAIELPLVQAQIDAYNRAFPHKRIYVIPNRQRHYNTDHNIEHDQFGYIIKYIDYGESTLQLQIINGTQGAAGRADLIDELSASKTEGTDSDQMISVKEDLGEGIFWFRFPANKPGTVFLGDATDSARNRVNLDIVTKDDDIYEGKSETLSILISGTVDANSPIAPTSSLANTSVKMIISDNDPSPLITVPASTEQQVDGATLPALQINESAGSGDTAISLDVSIHVKGQSSTDTVIDWILQSSTASVGDGDGDTLKPNSGRYIIPAMAAEGLKTLRIPVNINNNDVAQGDREFIITWRAAVPWNESERPLGAARLKVAGTSDESASNGAGSRVLIVDDETPILDSPPQLSITSSSATWKANSIHEIVVSIDNPATYTLEVPWTYTGSDYFELLATSPLQYEVGETRKTVRVLTRSNVITDQIFAFTVGESEHYSPADGARAPTARTVQYTLPTSDTDFPSHRLNTARVAARGVSISGTPFSPPSGYSLLEYILQPFAPCTRPNKTASSANFIFIQINGLDADCHYQPSLKLQSTSDTSDIKYIYGSPFRTLKEDDASASARFSPNAQVKSGGKNVVSILGSLLNQRPEGGESATFQVSVPSVPETLNDVRVITPVLQLDANSLYGEILLEVDSGRLLEEVVFKVNVAQVGASYMGEIQVTVLKSPSMSVRWDGLAIGMPLEVVEGDSNGGVAETQMHDLLVEINSSVSEDLLISWSTVDGTAVHGIDYEMQEMQEVRILAGQTQARIQIETKGDLIGEVTEQFYVRLSSDVSAPLLNAGQILLASIKISDNDQLVDASFGEENYVVNEGGNIEVEVELSAPAPNELTLRWIAERSDRDTAQPSVDFGAPITGQLTIAVGAESGSFQIPIVLDTLLEEDETFTLRLEYLSGKVRLLDENVQRTVTIKNVLLNSPEFSLIPSGIGLIFVTINQNKGVSPFRLFAYPSPLSSARKMRLEANLASTAFQDLESADIPDVEGFSQEITGLINWSIPASSLTKRVAIRVIDSINQLSEEEIQQDATEPVVRFERVNQNRSINWEITNIDEGLHVFGESGFDNANVEVYASDRASAVRASDQRDNCQSRSIPCPTQQFNSETSGTLTGLDPSKDYYLRLCLSPTVDIKQCTKNATEFIATTTRGLTLTEITAPRGSAYRRIAYNVGTSNPPYYLFVYPAHVEPNLDENSNCGNFSIQYGVCRLVEETAEVTIAVQRNVRYAARMRTDPDSDTGILTREVSEKGLVKRRVENNGVEAQNFSSSDYVEGDSLVYVIRLETETQAPYLAPRNIEFEMKTFGSSQTHVNDEDFLATSIERIVVIPEGQSFISEEFHIQQDSMPEPRERVLMIASSENLPSDLDQGNNRSFFPTNVACSDEYVIDASEVCYSGNAISEDEVNVFASDVLLESITASRARGRTVAYNTDLFTSEFGPPFYLFLYPAAQDPRFVIDAEGKNGMNCANFNVPDGKCQEIGVSSTNPVQITVSKNIRYAARMRRKEGNATRLSNEVSEQARAVGEFVPAEEYAEGDELRLKISLETSTGAPYRGHDEALNFVVGVNRFSSAMSTDFATDERDGNMLKLKRVRIPVGQSSVTVTYQLQQDSVAEDREMLPLFYATLMNSKVPDGLQDEGNIESFGTGYIKCSDTPSNSACEN
ncbi:MAG: Calx-beta domain-containing protein [Candidatus Eutrophobiaceae bacterium]